MGQAQQAQQSNSGTWVEHKGKLWRQDELEQARAMYESVQAGLDKKFKEQQGEAAATCKPITPAPEHMEVKKVSIADYTAVIDKDKVHYKDATGRTGFIDSGSKIELLKGFTEGDTLACLELARQKYGSFQVTGSPEFLKTCVSLAATHGFKLTNTDLQRDIAVQKAVNLSRAEVAKAIQKRAAQGVPGAPAAPVQSDLMAHLSAMAQRATENAQKIDDVAQREHAQQRA